MNRKYRRVIIAGNWKMNMVPSQVRDFAEGVRAIVPRNKWCEAVICAPFVDLHVATKVLWGNRINVGAQNVSQYPSGAYTGEVSAAMLKDMSIKYVIIGHSERRRYFNETDITVNQKVHAALEAGIAPIICVGESLEQREMGAMTELISYQVKMALHGVAPEKIRKIVIAYEPIWAIGTGRNATPEDANEICKLIRSVIRGLYGARVARSIPILYGGSMNDENAYDLLAQPDIDGGLIGGASLKPEKFAAIINAANQE